MDPLPQIPTSEVENDTVGVLRNAFSEHIEAEQFPLEVANNIVKYIVDEVLSLKNEAHTVFEINKKYVKESDKINDIEYELIKEHGTYMYNKHLEDKNIFLRELAKLKPCDIFTKTNVEDLENYGLIQKCDLYPDLARQFLDYRFNKTLHQCKQCFPDPEQKITSFISKNKTRLAKRAPKELEKAALLDSPKSFFKIEPSEIIFSNFDPGKVYEQTIKITNTSLKLHSVILKVRPKLPVFSLDFDGYKIAPGMTILVKIKFTPDVKLNLDDEFFFQSSKGQEMKISIKCRIKPPKLLGYVYRSNIPPSLDRHVPRSRRFSRKRRCVVNDTIDCGSCFVTDYILVNLILRNKGTNAKFFWIPEEDFYCENINKVSTCLEFFNEGFWLYPTYSEILKEETSLINILFQPISCGLHIQSLFLMCDNNTYKQIEIVGDSVCFSRNMIGVNIPGLTKDIDKKKGHSIFLGVARHKDFINFTLGVNNYSSLFLKCDIKFETRNDKFDMTKWIQVTNATPTLAPNSTTNLFFHVKPDHSVISGYYETALRLFLKDIPIASLEENETFLVTTNNVLLEEVVTNLSVIDVLALEVDVACYMEPKSEIIVTDCGPKLIECPKCEKTLCFCETCDAITPQADLVFCQPLLDLGILPTGFNIKKNIYIMNLGKTSVTWKIVEIKYNIDANPYVEIIPEENLSRYFGKLLPGKKKRISYKIVKTQPTRWVSILVLFSVSIDKPSEDEQQTNDILVAESICVVTYETIQLNINIKTGPFQDPILCPLQMLYTGVPFELSFKIQNNSLISGCFYFLKPIGDDAEKVHAEYYPQRGELRPHAQKTINVKLTCNDVGILEKIFLPCFIGQGQEPILVRLLCVVDCIHVVFYLPNKSTEYEKVLWPPKVLYEYDRSWSKYCVCEDISEDHVNIIKKSLNTIQTMEKSNITVTDIKDSNSNIPNECKSDTDSNPCVLKTLLNVDSEIFLQECIMQVDNVSTKQPRKIKIYIENISPKSAKYTIQSTNYVAKENLIEDALTISYKTTEELWEPMIEKHGILVNPDIESGILNPHEILSANIWIYANTWGIYTEEIVVDIEDIASFTFSMIIEIVGCPIHVPLGVGTITKYPTLRFGSVAVGANDITKNVVMANTSTIDVKISWHMFYSYEENDEETSGPFNFICDVIEKNDEKFEFDFTERFFGIECAESVEILPSQMVFPSNCTMTVPITFKPWTLKCADQKCFMRCYVLGRIFVAEEDGFKSNYYYRTNNSVIMELTAKVEKPHLDITAEAEDNTLYIYANEVTLNRGKQFYIPIIARNSSSSVIEAQLDCSEPFGFENKENEVILNPGHCKKIKLLCMLSYENIVKWAPHVYNLTEIKEFYRPNRESSNEEGEKFRGGVKPFLSTEKYIDEDKKILTLYGKLNVHYKGGFKDVIPVNVCIHYPHIAVKPIHVKFGYVLIGRTQKTTISVYNLTGYKIIFEILKSTSGQEIVVTPCQGDIEKSTGMNHSFVDITIFFTPTECKNYHESIRICTNIPQYHIDIPIKGAASLNEKFDSIC